MGKCKKSKDLVSFLLNRQITSSHGANYSDAVLKVAETKAAKPHGNKACELSGQTRSTFLTVSSDDGTKLASLHGDHTVRVTDVATGKCTHILTGHPRTPWCAAFHPSSSTILASGCLGGEVRIWDLHGCGSEVWQISTSTIASLTFHPVDHVLVIAMTNQLYFWDWSQPEPFACCETASPQERVRWVKFGPHGHNLYTGIHNLSDTDREEYVMNSNSDSREGENRPSLNDRYQQLMMRYRQERALIQQGSDSNGTSSDSDNERRSPVDTLNVANDRIASGANERTNFQTISQESTFPLSQRLLVNNDTIESTETERVLSRARAILSTDNESQDTLDTGLNDWNRSREYSPSRPNQLVSNNTTSATNRVVPNSSIVFSNPWRLSVPSSSGQTSSRQGALSSPRQGNLRARPFVRRSILRSQLHDETSQSTNRAGNRNCLNCNATDCHCSLSGSHGNDHISIPSVTVLPSTSTTPSLVLTSPTTNQPHVHESTTPSIPTPSNELRQANADSHSQLEVVQQTADVAMRDSRDRMSLNSLNDLRQRLSLIRQNRDGAVQGPPSLATTSLTTNQAHVHENATPSIPTPSNELRQEIADGRVELEEAQQTADMAMRESLEHARWRNSRDRMSRNSLDDLRGRLRVIRRNRDDAVQGLSARRAGRPDLDALSFSAYRLQRMRMAAHYRNLTSQIQRRNVRVRQNRDHSWHTLQRRYLHPDYSSSIFDDTINRPSDALQSAINRAIAGAFVGSGEAAVASNILSTSHRIQRWDFTKFAVPDISNAKINIIVPSCKIHSDGNCTISQDGRLIAAFVPSHQGFPDDTILGIFSLDSQNQGQCLYTKKFGPNAVSISISPRNHFVLVGLASKRSSWMFNSSKQMVAQVYCLEKENAGEDSMKHVTDIFHPIGQDVVTHVSVNTAKWLTHVGGGIVYGTNRGDLHFCQPGVSEPVEDLSTDDAEMGGSSLRRNLMHFLGMNIPRTMSASTQTVMRGVADRSDSDSDEFVL